MGEIIFLRSLHLLQHGSEIIESCIIQSWMCAVGARRRHDLALDAIFGRRAIGLDINVLIPGE